MSDNPVRLLIAVPDGPLFNSLLSAAYARAEECYVASIATTHYLLQNNLRDVQPEVTIAHLDLVTQMGEETFGSIMRGLPSSAAIIIAPPEMAQTAMALKTIDGVYDVATDLGAPAKIIERAIQIGLRMREKQREIAPGVTFTPTPHTGPSIPRQKVVAVVAYKGGSGKTTIATNLWWWANAHAGKSLIMGMDALDDVGVVLGLPPRPNMMEFFQHPDIDGFQRGLQKYHDKDVLLSPNNERDVASIDQDQIRELVLTARDLDYAAIVIDTPPTYTHWALGPMRHSNEVILVIEPRLTDVRKTVQSIQLLTGDALQQLRVPRDKLRVVINKRTDVTSLRVSDIEAMFRRSLDGWTPPIVGVVPWDPLVGEEQNKGEVSVDKRPDSAFARAIEGIATAVLGVQPTAATSHRKKGGLRFAIRFK